MEPFTPDHLSADNAGNASVSVMDTNPSLGLKTKFFKIPLFLYFIAIFVIIGGYIILRSYADTTTLTQVWDTTTAWQTGTLSNLVASNNAVTLATNHSYQKYSPRSRKVVTSYDSSGSITLDFNAGTKMSWKSLTPIATTPKYTNVTYEERSSSNNSTWSAWTSSVSSLASTQYLQIKATLSTSSSTTTPTLSKLTLVYSSTSATPTVSLSANPTSITSGQTSSLTWSSTNATSCTASGGWSGSEPTSGSLDTAALTATTTYNVSCTAVGQTAATASVTVTVNPATTTTSSTNDFVTASGTNLMLNGKVWQFIGFDAYGMAGCWNGTSGSAWTNAQLDTYFSGLPANGLTRLWATQEWGTAVISNIVAQATKYNQHVVLVLGNDDGNCDATADDPGQTGEPLSFYQSTWQTQYVSWVKTIVPIFADNPTVAMWEIANEPGQAVTVPESTMQSYLSGAAAAIKAVDPNHLVESGVNDGQNLGGTEADVEAAQSSPNINVISFHDYSWDYENGATLSGNFTAAQEAAAALNKPFIVGEAGVEACNPASGTNSQNGLAWMTPSQRVTYLQTKANDYLKGIGPSGQGSPNAAGIMFWDYEPTGSDGCYAGSYDIVPGDPLLPVVQNYTL